MIIKESPLVQMAAEARRPTPWWLGWIIAFGVGVAGMQLVWAGPMAAIGAASGTPVSQVFELLISASTIAVVFLWVRFKEQRPISSIGFRGSRGIAKLLLGIVLGVVMFLVPTGLLLLTGQYRIVPTPSGSSGGLGALPLVAALVLVWIVQASAEEVVMRGYLLQTHALQLPGWLAIVITSVGFAVAHLGAGPIALVNIALVACFWSFLSLRQGSIWLACGMHAGWNFTQGNILGIPVSGHPYTNALVFMQPTPGSSDWLTGGTFGIEQSFAATVLLAILAVWAFFSLRSARSSGRTDAAVEPAVEA
jgi:uncharacterized protein